MAAAGAELGQELGTSGQPERSEALSPMRTSDMRRMANQVAAFFAAYPDDEAVDGVARHLESFWDPRMRRKLLEDFAATRGEGLLPLARQAVERLAARPN